jgi:hypothetical protein
MNCFSLVKNVLDETYAQIPGNESERDELIKSKLEYLQRQYEGLFKGNKVDYSDYATKFAYIYKYVTCHANCVLQILKQNQGTIKVQGSEVNLACLGVGPGSDVLGIIKYLNNGQKLNSFKLKFNLFDRDKTWEDYWEIISQKVKDSKNIGFLPYHEFDILNPDNLSSNVDIFQKADIFTMSYFMSEVFTYCNQPKEYFDKLFSQAKSGSYFLFIDNNSPQYYQLFDDLAKAHNVNILKNEEREFGMPYDEQKSDLGIYFTNFAHYPKLEADIAYRIGKKQ